jgi:hypothetical protein
VGRVPWCWMGEGGTAGSVGWGGGGQGDDHVNKVRGLCDIMVDGAGERSWGV